MTFLNRYRLAVAGGVLTVVGVIYLVLATSYSLGTLDQPGPGLFPVAVGVLLAGTAIGTLLEGIRRPLAEAVPEFDRRSALRTVLVFAVVVGYVLLVGVIGHLLASTIAAAILLKSQGTKWLWTIVVALALGFASQFVFDDILGVPLPTLTFG